MSTHLYQVYLFNKPFALIEAESPTNAITGAKLSSPLFHYEPYSHFKAEQVEQWEPDEQIWLPDGSNYTTDRRIKP